MNKLNIGIVVLSSIFSSVIGMLIDLFLKEWLIIGKILFIVAILLLIIAIILLKRDKDKLNSTIVELNKKIDSLNNTVFKLNNKKSCLNNLMCEKVKEIGIESISNNLSDSDFEPAKCFNTTNFDLSFLGLFGSKWLRKDKLMGEFLKKIKRQQDRGKVKFLLLNPESETFSKVLELKGEFDSKKEAYRGNLKIYNELQDKYPSFRVRLYDSLPTFRLIFIDNNTIGVSKYSLIEGSNNSTDNLPYIKISRKTEKSLFETFIRYFDNIWDNYSIPLQGNIKKRESLNTKSIDILTNKFCITNAHDELINTCFYPPLCMQNIKNKLYFMGTFGSKWAQNDESEFENFLERMDNVENAQIKFLLINPTGKHFQDLKLKRQGKITISPLHKFLEKTKKYDFLEVRLYDNASSFRLTFIDNKVLAFTYNKHNLHEVKKYNSGKKSPILEICNNGDWSLYNAFENYFEDIWGKSIDLNEVHLQE